MRHDDVVRKTRIVATLGPASSTPEVVVGLVDAGASVFRLNCSHLSTDNLRSQIDFVHAAVPQAGVLVDIQGPKMRYGGSLLDLRDGEEMIIPFDLLGLGGVARAGGMGALETGHRLLLDDGRIEARVIKVEPDAVAVSIVHGGVLKPNKGVNLPDTPLVAGVLSEKDRADLAVARECGADFVAVSFVQEPRDIEVVRNVLGDGAMVIAKIERPQALARLDEICAVSDGVMAARGDLGVELPYESIPVAQHRIGNAALLSGKVSICATEMLESMISSSRPTRAEVADVSAAVRDGFDAVMLSGETAVGHDPIGTVRAMARICEAAEREVSMPNVFADANPQLAAVTAATSALAKRVGASSIVSLTFTGYSARLLAACRPSSPIIAVTPSDTAARALNLCRGVTTLVVDRAPGVGDAIAGALQACRANGLLAPGDKVVICASRVSPRSDADTVLLHVEDMH